MIRLLIALLVVTLAACEERLILTEPGLIGPLTNGTWEQRQKDGLSFWPPSADATRLPELIDFSCVEGVKEVRFTLTGDMDKTGLWIAEDGRSARTAIIETSEGVTRVEFFAGQKKLPSAQVKVSEPWFQPFRAGFGVIAINAYGHKVYRIQATEELKETIAYCE